jgi:hypothetical protein
MQVGSNLHSHSAVRNIVILLVILLISNARHSLEPLRPNFLFPSTDVRGVWSEVRGFFTSSHDRREWADSLNDDDSTVRFLATGASSRTLLVIVFPSSRVDEDFTQDEILYDSDSDEVEFRKELKARGFTEIRVNDNDPKALPPETREQDARAVVVDSGSV